MNQLINTYAKENGISEIKLNLGSGGRPLKGFINIDNYDYEKTTHLDLAPYMMLRWIFVI